jgi:hypothetical protein
MQVKTTVMPFLKNDAILLEAARTSELDIRFAVKKSDALKLEFDFSEMFQTSTSRPWNFSKVDFASLEIRSESNSFQIEAKNSSIALTATLKLQGRLLAITSSWQNLSAETIKHASVATILKLPSNLLDERITMPHILYNDNPSADSSRLVPKLGNAADATLICEENRFPIPCINVEWFDQNPRFINFMSLPSADNCEWSLGCMRSKGQLHLIGSSGVIAFNGKKDVTYGGQNKAITTERGYRDYLPGEIWTKTYYLEIGQVAQTGWGFRSISELGNELLQPKAQSCLSLKKVIELKSNALEQRWHEDGEIGGFLCRPRNLIQRPPYFLYGWTGQSIRLAWCTATLGFRNKNEVYIERCRKAVDWYVHNSKTLVPGLRWSHYFIKDKQWRAFYDNGLISSRALGESTYNLGRVITLFQKNGRPVPKEWSDAILSMAEFVSNKNTLLPEGILPRLWTSDGIPHSTQTTAAGIPCVMALIAAYRCSNDRRYLQEAIKLYEIYWYMFGDKFDRPFAGSTLDANCEDKEAGLYAFQAALELYSETQNEKFRVYAEVAADWIMTFVYHWDTPFRKESPCDQWVFKTTGWPGVSVQNHHLDVFFPAYEMYAFGRQIKNAYYEKMGRNIFDAWSHGIAQYPNHWGQITPGEQGEQFFQTNYWQGPFDQSSWNGGYHAWNPSWIIALVLEAALLFESEENDR